MRDRLLNAAECAVFGCFWFYFALGIFVLELFGYGDTQED